MNLCRTQLGGLGKNFAMDNEGYRTAVLYLVRIGKFGEFLDSIDSVDGYGLVHFANIMKEKGIV